MTTFYYNDIDKTVFTLNLSIKSSDNIVNLGEVNDVDISKINEVLSIIFISVKPTIYLMKESFEIIVKSISSKKGIIGRDNRNDEIPLSS